MAHNVYQNNGSFQYTNDPTSAGSVVKPATGSVTARHEQFGPFCKTILTLDNVPQSVVNGVEYQSTHIFNFPEGKIWLVGSVGTLRQKTTSELASTINSGVTGAVSFGSAAASATTLTTTMVNMMATTAFTSSTTVNVAGTAVNGTLNLGTALDGTSTPVKIYLNSAYATTGDVDGDGTQTFSGKLELTWINLGDYS